MLTALLWWIALATVIALLLGAFLQWGGAATDKTPTRQRKSRRLRLRDRFVLWLRLP